MSEEAKKEMGVTFNTVVTIISALVLGWLAWSNRQQLENISLKQDKAILQAQAEAQQTFVSKQWFQAEDSMLRAADTANASAIQVTSSALSELKTDIAVIKTELQKQNR